MSNKMHARIDPKDTLSEIRGMSEPFAFSFDVLDKGRRMLVHAVVFTSYEIHGDSQTQINLCTLDKDPRMRRFVKYATDNFAQEKAIQLRAQVADIEVDIRKRKAELAALQEKITALGKEAQNEQ